MAGSLGLDISNKRLLAVVRSIDGTITHKARYRMDRHQQPRSCASLLLRAIEDAQSQVGTVDGVGIGFPGIVDAAKGIARSSTTLPGWENIRLANTLATATGVPCAIDNRVNNNARAELALRQSQPNNFLFVSSGDSIEASLVLNGHIWNGNTGLGGQLGHTTVIDSDEECSCGNVGCLQQVASSTAIAHRLNVEPHDIAICVQTRPEASKQVLSEAGFALGRAIAMALNLLNFELVVLAGPLSGFATYREAVEISARNHSMDLVQAACVFEQARAGISGKGLGAAVLAGTLTNRGGEELRSSAA